LKILSFDASTAELHLSISEASKLTASQTLKPDSDRNRYTASEIIPAIDALLLGQNWNKADLDAIVVGIGPGSFTGVRVAVVTGRTLGQALNLPVMGVSIFDCYAKLMREPVGILIDAGGSSCYVASYRSSQERNEMDGLLQIDKPQCVRLDAVTQMLASSNRWLVSPSLLAEVGKNTNIKIEPLPDLNNIAVLQSEIASYRLSLKESAGDRPTLRARLVKEFPYQSVRPLYLRQASITLKSYAK
jgi:tRNA threonylcarbamoyl adenosine modification protein YeaZ